MMVIMMVVRMIIIVIIMSRVVRRMVRMRVVRMMMVVVVVLTRRSMEAVLKQKLSVLSVLSESLSLAMFVGLKILASRLVSGSDPDKLLQHN